MEIRAVVQRLIDEAQFRFDTVGGNLYQPLPWLGLHQARRGTGTRARWRLLAPLLDAYPLRTALDLGCHTGYFSMALAQRGIVTLGVDADERALRIARYATNRLHSTRLAFSCMMITPDTLDLLPQVDLVLVLSIWHHWVRSYGLAGASAILATIWRRTNQILVFETGEDEMPADFRLPNMQGNPAGWLAGYLAEQCAGGTVRPLGQAQAFAPGGDERRHVAYRTLFMVAQPGVAPMREPAAAARAGRNGARERA